MKRYGKWALVTGATSGIGRALTQQLAAAGLNVVIVSRTQSRLDTLAEVLRAEHGVQVRVIPMDLSIRQGVDDLIDQVDVEIDVLVPCAAMETRGYFVDSSAETHRRVLDMDCYGPMRLSHHFGQNMALRGRGAILLVSSLSGWTGQPYMAHYGAVKAYILSLGEGLHQEMKDKGVDVTVLSPGPTDTGMAPKINAELVKLGMVVMSPDIVAATGLKALGRQPNAVPGFRNKMMLVMMTRMMPRAWVGAISRWMMARVVKIRGRLEAAEAA